MNCRSSTTDIAAYRAGLQRRGGVAIPRRAANLLTFAGHAELLLSVLDCQGKFHAVTNRKPAHRTGPAG
jgi:hypothetical protein